MSSLLFTLTWTLIVFIAIESVSSQEIACNDTKTKLFQCKDGGCVSREHFCNDNNTCSDGSDELPYDNTTETGAVPCRYRRTNLVDKECALPKQYRCDHELDCIGGYDECGCEHTFLCDDGDCALKVSFCDNLPPDRGCLDGTDERPYNRTTKEGFQCPVTRTHITKVCVLPDRYVCDGDSDCDFGIDECFCDFSAGGTKGVPLNDVYSNDKCFRCLDGSLVIPNILLCDGIVHCEDLSDECLCPVEDGKNRPAICDSVCEGADCDCPGQIQCVPKQQTSDVITADGVGDTKREKICINRTAICDDSYDCESQVDENFCPLDDQSFECYDRSRKIKFYQVCDGPADCDDQSDEIYCREITNHYCSDYRRFFSDVTDWKNVTEEDGVMIPPGRRLSFDRPFFTQACDGIPFCTFFDDECGNDCPNEPGYCSYVTRGFRCPNSGSLIIGMEICDGKPTCNDTAPDLSADEYDCPSSCGSVCSVSTEQGCSNMTTRMLEHEYLISLFYCNDNGKNRLPIHIPMEGRCNGKQECDDQSDELNCSESTHFYCEDGGSTLFVPMSQKCDGRQDCKGGRDECQECNPSPFSSDEKLISNRVLIVFLWIIGLFAVIGNSAVIIHQIHSLIRPPGASTPVAISNRILVLNLSASDLLVGIYLVALGIKDATVSKYCLMDQEWRSGPTCSALGSIALIGTETSVFILLIMTAYRLYLVIRPFKSQKMLVIGLAIVSAWALSFILAFAPLAITAQDYFVSCVWFRTHHFIGKVCKNDLQKFTSDLVTLEGSNRMFSNNIASGYTWENMFNAMKQLNSSYVPERFFGYYSAHSVCLPRLFPDPKMDEGWGYSLLIILLNFFAFVFILISYVFIYKKTTGQSIKKANAEDRAASLQRKVSRIVLTDFCCWMPICIMAFIKVSGVDVPDLVYAVTAIILLPINSAMNPFLYSDILDIVWEKLSPARTWLRSTSVGQKVEKKLSSRKGSSKKEKAGPAMHSSQSETRSTIIPSATQLSPGNETSIALEMSPKEDKANNDHVYYSIGKGEANGAYDADGTKMNTQM